ncbi:RimJ/RimL family protein N-acetyltransferase [Paenibacillus endophyticus]|uniref:RimJ/RimL family protein N-acetyltransferase n=1 Tax=Paenibacillus endophyticus TaxID=1294268 RepID=A0A7W5CFK8_9BACL|nr:GNAT family N-acetyltransferase [Paenibacillus endophyticus]MBB3155989.1 RimJ/RimL family protein N-acetyltransferase [Paenibacillus endophyticus]
MTSNQSSHHYNREILDMTIHPLEISHAMEICSWRYEAPFHCYNWPAWEHMKKDEIEFGDSVLRASQYAAVLDNQLGLMGFAQFFPIAGVTRLGLGLRPDLCSRGLGPAFTKLIVSEAMRRTPNNEIDLEVIARNTRAIRAYQQAGFRITDTYSRATPAGFAECHCMVYGIAGT